ncbi:MAG TPA: acyl-CoA dehydrogenase family protein [Acidimicrobiales bacterium]|nr:acyl-CoA dehydrogenase family protein [Acidimicrobiales bacterium]
MSLDETRAEVGAWLDANWDPELSLRDWRDRFVDSGWACPSWPTEFFGRGLPAAADAIVDDELARVGGVGTPTGVSMGLAAPTILAHGSDDLKRRFLRPILTGEHTWCQLFSEPGSGSDLAGLTTRADRDGDEFIISGQKVWNTSAHHADYGLLVARTDWDAPKHRGITFFAFPMRQPGVEVRPLRQMNGYSSFNEVFLSEARVPADHVVGDVGNGWAVAVTTLAVERASFAAFARRRAVSGTGRAAKEAQAEADSYFQTYVWYPQRAGRPDLVVDRARELGRTGDAVVRQKIAALLSLQRVAQWTAQRPGPHGSLHKLLTTKIARASAEVHTLIGGANGMVSGDLIAEVLVSVPAISIAGGTDEVQRNIIGERVLGLPKEPQVDRDIPFRDVPRNVR